MSLQATERGKQEAVRYHKYDTLPTEQSARYLVLQPANESHGQLVCTLHTAEIDDFPSYETISYVWGPAVKPETILCNGQTVPITTSLFQALMQVRYSDKSRVLWVDSVCINQQDPKEQGAQVSMMGTIYARSTSTLICLGDSDPFHASHTAKLVSDVNGMIERTLSEADDDWEPNSFPWPEESQLLGSEVQWQSFGVLLGQPWFTRGWVVQEAALSQSAVLLWAKMDFSWIALLRTYCWARSRALIVSDELRLSYLHLQAFSSLRPLEIGLYGPAVRPMQQILKVLDCARWLRLSDPRDRIYAFLSLTQPDSSLSTLKPDYEKPYLLVYRDFAVEYLRSKKDLDILHFVRHDNESIDSDLASWIPRWDVCLYSDYNGGLHNCQPLSDEFCAQHSYSEPVLLSDQMSLKLHAMIFGTVTFAGPCFDKDGTTANDVASLWDAVSTTLTKSVYVSPPLTTFVTIFRCGVYRGRLTEWQRLEEAYMRFLQRKPLQGKAQLEDAETFHKLRMQDVHNKRIIFLDRGYYGLAPGVVQPGDVCGMIFGARSLFLLRRTDEDGRYKILGSILVLSKDLDHNGRPKVFGHCESEWKSWELEEKQLLLC